MNPPGKFEVTRRHVLADGAASAAGSMLPAQLRAEGSAPPVSAEADSIDVTSTVTEPVCFTINGTLHEIVVDTRSMLLREGFEVTFTDFDIREPISRDLH